MRHSHEWEARYQKGSTGWDRGDTNPALLHWLESGDLAPCRILLPGCGRGHEVPHLAHLGFAITAVDFAPSAVAHLQTELENRALAAEVIEADVLHWQADAPFDAVYEQTCLCALPPDSWEAYEAQLYNWLRPGGKLFVLFMQTGADGGPPHHCDLLAMRKLFIDTRWEWPTTTPIISPHNNGRFELGYILRQRSGAV